MCFQQSQNRLQMLKLSFNWILPCWFTALVGKRGPRRSSRPWQRKPGSPGSKLLMCLRTLGSWSSSSR
ncbi:hypothetical protein B296_00003646 [Ensete ventricosum]|uniref:Uncharacterized protein n=1 Tax=Ensete ventricosum TaxID=4639 RepID=A0A426ZKG6_ENSVE|nr:hypothetical protein B296_00003646 [Ensete ventricosum]